MWYFVWVLGTILACAFGVINALWYDSNEHSKYRKHKDL